MQKSKHAGVAQSSRTHGAVDPNGRLRRLLVAALTVSFMGVSHTFAAPPAGPHSAGPAPAATTPADVAADIDFLLQAWRANALELGAARLALESSRDTRVRQFARALVRDHSAANLRLQRLAAARGLGIPAAVAGVQPEQEFELAGLRGVAFDRRFVERAGIEGHRKVLALYRHQVEHGRDRALVGFASEGLSMLRRHLARSEALEAQFELQRRNAASPR